VFRDWNGIMHTSAMWNPGLGRFLLTMSHSQASAGNVSIFEADELWGRWRPVLYEWAWGQPYLEPNTFYWNFSPKWLSPDGRSFAMIFTGMDENDSWNLVLGVFNLTAPMKTGGQWRDAAGELIEGLGDGVEGAAGTIDSLLENVDGAAGVTDTTASAETADTIAAAAK
jgi:hypothetical protein